MNIDDIPEQLMENRDAVECNFIFCLWKDISQVPEYSHIFVNGTDVITPDGQFYYGLVNELSKAGYTSIDNVSIYTFLENKTTFRKGFERRGGWQTVKEIMEILNVDNISAYQDELTKSNLLIRLHENGFDVLQNLEKFKQMSYEQVYDFYEYKLANISVGKLDKLVAEDLSTGYDKFIEEWNAGVNVGYPIGFPILNYQLAGIHKGNIMFHLAHIGNGKTTSSILFYILPSLERGENVCFIGNEASNNEMRMMMLSTVLFNKVRYFGMNRQKITLGHYTQEQVDKLHEAADWMENCPGKLKFIDMPDYGVNKVKKVIKKYSKIGYGLFIFDTLKAEQESDDKAWALLSDVAKQLYLLAKKEQVAIICTAQLSGESMKRRYLDLDCVGKSKAISEVATQVIMFRTMRGDEKEKLKVYSWKPNANGVKVKQIIDLDPEKDYIILFVPKNRFGSTTPQIVYERNMSFNEYFELGYVNVEYDGFGR